MLVLVQSCRGLQLLSVRVEAYRGFPGFHDLLPERPPRLLLLEVDECLRLRLCAQVADLRLVQSHAGNGLVEFSADVLGRRHVVRPAQLLNERLLRSIPAQRSEVEGVVLVVTLGPLPQVQPGPPSVPHLAERSLQVRHFGQVVVSHHTGRLLETLDLPVHRLLSLLLQGLLILQFFN